MSPRFSEGPCLKKWGREQYREIPRVDLWPPQRSYSCIHICTHTYMHTCTHTQRDAHTEIQKIHISAYSQLKLLEHKPTIPTGPWPTIATASHVTQVVLLLITHFQQKRLPTTPVSGLTGSPSVSRSRKNQGTDVLEGSYLWLWTMSYIWLINVQRKP